MNRAFTSPKTRLSVLVDEGEPVIRMVVPEACDTGDTVNIWTTERALHRLKREIKAALATLEAAKR